MVLDEILKWVFRIAGAYYFAGFLYNIMLLYEYRLYKGTKLEKEYTNILYNLGSLYKYILYRETNLEDDYIDITYNEEPKQTRIAVMVPVFREENVIGRTLDFLVKAAEAYDPKLVRVYVGTYPNDLATRKIVNEFERNYPSIVEEVVNPKPGPTTKAQNLNNIYDNIKRKFDLIGIHDAEDFIPFNIFNATNYWHIMRVKNDEKLAGLQFAVRAKTDNYSLTNSVYMLTFRLTNLFLTAKNKGFVPSHGTGTYYKQGTLDEVLKRRGYVWDEKNFTEDFEVSLYLYHVIGKTLLYIPYPYIEEYFPSSFKRAVKQMSRWSYGILQSSTKHFKNIIKNFKNIDDLIYTSSFVLSSFSFFWWLFIPYLILSSCCSVNFLDIEKVIYLINSVNGIRFSIEVPLLYETLKLSKKETSSFKRILKDLGISLYIPFLGASSSSYMIYRFLIKRNLQWTKTEHK